MLLLLLFKILYMSSYVIKIGQRSWRNVSIYISTELIFDIKRLSRISRPLCEVAEERILKSDAESECQREH
jgi:hypothetical protein